MNPLFKRQQKGQRHGGRSEKRVARKFKARLRPASGAMAGAKGDMVKPEFLIEAKSTVFATLALHLEWLDKIHREALETNRIPALTISFVHANGDPRPNSDWVVVPSWWFREKL